ncbi:MAG: D-alanine--D-alanine ligase family protein [Arcticibacter sp.]
MKIRIGVVFGGTSREREISFAGGRTVYDNLDKSLFDAVPIFIDSFNNFIILDWEFIYKGSIRDFYPPFEKADPSPNGYQVYAESLGDLDPPAQLGLVSKLGTRIEPSSMSSLIDFAFLCLHGTNGEDGRIQGLLEFYGVPYSGTGIFSSAVGMNKHLQKDLMARLGLKVPEYSSIDRQTWLSVSDYASMMKIIGEKVGSPFVVKSANQGSSIGVSFVDGSNADDFRAAVDRSLFIRRVTRAFWTGLNHQDKVEYVRSLSDMRDGIGLPLAISDKVIYHPEELLSNLNQLFSEPGDEYLLESMDSEQTVLFEGFITGKEFSCIVIDGLDGRPIALPPTEIRKGSEVYDYRSKYLPGLSRKITPIDLPAEAIEQIRKSCCYLFDSLGFGVYARIDGFYTSQGDILLNDPNTTSGMLPSSFFFHQAAEIGLTPSQFITFIIHRSLRRRTSGSNDVRRSPMLLKTLERCLQENKKSSNVKKRIAVILGGYSSERHISVESGRNIFEKLSSSEKYLPIPVFLSGNSTSHKLHVIPVNILLKDNADDIREKVLHFDRHPVLQQIIDECHEITDMFSNGSSLNPPYEISYSELAGIVDGVFIALHGRPGEDGEVQSHLDRVGLPYNGSGPTSSRITIDKYETNEILMSNGVHAASHMVVYGKDWRNDPSHFEDQVLASFNYPIIAKPVDDGCSSAVKIIRNSAQLHAFCELIFRESDELPAAAAEILKIKPKEEFPIKDCFLVEDLILKGDAERFLEITGGLMTSYAANGELRYEVFEASEALSEGDVLSLEEKFLAGQGQNITPARYSSDPSENRRISSEVKKVLEQTARLLHVEGYARIDAFVRIFKGGKVEVLVIEVNSLPGMTPATCIFHQAAINDYKPFEFIDMLIDFGIQRKKKSVLKEGSDR